MEDKFCKQCGNLLPKDKIKNKYCNHSCASKIRNLGIRRHGKKPGNCLTCGKNLLNSTAKYCSVDCHQQHKTQLLIDKWKSGGHVSKGVIKKYLLSKYDNRCSICGWSEVNKFTGTIPLELEHVDGNYLNNKEDNLTILCPNCHSLTPTYKGANKGNGRHYRKKYYNKQK